MLEYPLALLLITAETRTIRQIERLVAKTGDLLTLDYVRRPDDALKRLHERPFDMILLDLTPSDLVSLTSLAALQRQSAPVPIVALIAQADAAQADVVLEAGAQEYLIKDGLRSDMLLCAARYAARYATSQHDRYIQPSTLASRSVGDILAGAPTAPGDPADLRLALPPPVNPYDAYLAALMRVSMDALIVADADLRIQLFNTAAEQVFGCPAGAVLGQPAHLLIPLDRQQLHTGHSFGAPLLITALHADGTEFPAALTIVSLPAGGPSSYMLAIRDLSWQSLGVAQDAPPLPAGEDAAVCLIGLADGRLAYADAAFAQLLGYGRDDWHGRTLSELGVCSDLAQQHLLDRLRADAALRDLPLVARSKSGALCDLHIAAERIAIADDTYSLCRLLAQPHGRPGQDEIAALQDTLLDSIVDGIFIAQDYQFMFANPALPAMLGYTPEEFIGRPFADIVAPAFLDIWNERFARRIAGEADVPLHYEVCFLQKGGELLWVELRASRIQYNGRPAALGIIRDISKRKDSERALRESELRLRQLSESLPQLVWTCRRDGECDFLNAQWVAYTGIAPESQLGFGWMERLHPDDRLLTMLAWNRAVALGTLFDVEFRLRRRDGAYRWFKARAVPLHDTAGQISKWFGTNTDIEDQKQIEAALRQERDLLNKIIATAPGVICSFRLRPDQTVCFPFASPRIQEIYGLPPEAFAADAGFIFSMMPPEDALLIQQTVAESARTMQPWHAEFRVRHPERGEIWVEGRSMPVSEPDGSVIWHGFIADISSRKYAEMDLHQTTELLRTVTETARVGLAIVDTEHCYRYANSTYKQILHLPPENELAGLRVADVLGDLYQDLLRARLDRTLGGERVNAYLVPPVERPEDLRRYAVRLEPTVDRSGPVAVVVLMDVTERERAEIALRQSEERFATVFRTSSAAITVSRLSDGTFIDLNESYEQMVGYSREELIGNNGMSLGIFSAEARAEAVHLLLAQGYVRDYEMTIRTKVGESRDVLFSLDVIELMEESCLLTILIDITARRQTERALERFADRLHHLRQIDQVLLSNGLLSEIIEFTLMHVGHLIPSTRVSLLFADHTEQLLRAGALQVLGQIVAPPPLAAPIQLLGDALLPLMHGHIYYIADLAAVPDLPPLFNVAHVERVQAYFYTPIMAGAELMGLLAIGADQPGSFTNEHMDIAREVADQLSVALQQARLRGQIEQHSQDLERIVAERTAELAAANHELEAFSYSVSHDLRAPLRAIDGFSRILIEDFTKDISDEMCFYLQLVRTNSQQMGSLIDSLLAFARLSRQPIQRQQIAMEALVRQCLDALQAEHAERQVEFDVADLPDSFADPILLRQVWMNLLSNALKYTRSRAVAQIAIGYAQHPDETVYFVKDNGVGFDMRYIDKLFGVFQRMHRAEDYEGTGVGLAIVQRIIHRHGGRVWAEAAVDQGATFFFVVAGGGGERESARDIVGGG